MIWGSGRPGCIIVTSGGKHGDRAGYADLRLPDGSWYYIGQGSTGDQSPDNYANSLVINGNRDILLFTTREPTAKEAEARGTRGKQYKFQGIFKLGAWSFIVPDKGTRTGDRLIRFLLIPAKNIYGAGGDPVNPESKDDSVSNVVPSENTQPSSLSKLVLIEFRRRSRLVKEHALSRANGICEHCGQPAPFIPVNGSPFLEVHHIFSLADDGPDEPTNVAAVCPNCHRELHFGVDIKGMNDRLYAAISDKEVQMAISKSGLV